ncbi:MAG: hypothetical protein ABJP48_09705 [Erythrobacter sp.]
MTIAKYDFIERPGSITGSGLAIWEALLALPQAVKADTEQVAQSMKALMAKSAWP